jgi:hypothetical protein
MICTDEYVAKANLGEGGVGYEKMIMTAPLLSKIGHSKVIPIIRQSGSVTRPTFIESKFYINFTNDEDIEYSLDDLLRAILQAPLYEKPEIGSSPFKPLEGARPDRTSDGVKEVMKAVAACYDKTSAEYIRFKHLIPFTSMRRLTFDRYMHYAADQGLINWTSHETLKITDDGINYLIAHGIIDA